MGPRNTNERSDRGKTAGRAEEPAIQPEDEYDEAVADSFPASDPPSPSSGIVGPGRIPQRRSPDKA